MAGVGVSDSGKSVGFFHFYPLFCSVRDKGQSGAELGMGMRQENERMPERKKECMCGWL